MKKILFSLILLIGFCAVITAQENDVSTTKVEKNAMRIGVLGNFQPTLGELSKYVSSDIGGGLAYEIDLYSNPSSILTIGVPVHANFDYYTVIDENLVYTMGATFTSGVYARIKLLNGRFIIQPELDYGVKLIFPKENEMNSGRLESMYLDQVIQLAIGFRYSLQGKVNMEFDLSPVFTLSPESNNIAYYIGARAGVLFRIK